MPGLVIHVIPTRTAGTPRLTVSVPETPHPVTAAPDGAELLLQSDKDPFASLMKRPSPERVVLQCGKELYTSLKQVDRFAKTNLRLVPRTGIYFKLESPLSENLPWEALWDDAVQQFVALNPNLPVARLPATSFQVKRQVWVEPELTILLVLAAAVGDGTTERVDAMDEWTEIWRALSGLPSADRIRVHVLTCQTTILEAIQNLAAPKVRITAERLATAQTFDEAVKVLSPNIVHFFCHGSASDTEPRLNLATVGDYDAELPEGTIWLGMAQLETLTNSASLWTVTLNCCEGGHASGHVRSLAGKLAEQGVPAVVAMRESVNFHKANQFAGAFYKHLIGTLAAALPDDAAAQAGAETSVDEDVWLDAVHRSRQLLANVPSPYDDPAWTLPLVYVQRGPLALKARPRSAGLLDLLSEAQRTPITNLRMGAATLRSVLTRPQTVALPPAFVAEMQAQAAQSDRAANQLEHDALVATLAAGGLSALHVSMATQRVSDLAKLLV